MERYALEKSPLYQLKNKRALSKLLDLAPHFFQKHRQGDDFFAYGETVIKRKDNSDRVVSIPGKELKLVQKQLLRLLGRIHKPSWLISGRKGRSYVDNARSHRGNGHVVTLDVKSFYDSCQRTMVYKMFRDKFLVAPDVAGALTDLVANDHCVPTGAPTSQMIAFFILEDVFAKLNLLANKCGCTFTLYVDDMTISSKSQIPKALILEIEKELKQCNIRLKWSKARRYSPKQCKVITGAVLDGNGVLRVPNKLRHSIIKGIQKVDKLNKEDGVKEFEEAVLKVQGQLCAARQIEPGIFPAISRKLPKVVRMYRLKGRKR